MLDKALVCPWALKKANQGRLHRVLLKERIYRTKVSIKKTTAIISKCRNLLELKGGYGIFYGF
jgi:hypothetical protein